MTIIEIGKWKYKYCVGPFTVGIIPPSGHKHCATIEKVQGDGKLAETRNSQTGTGDGRVSPDEVAAYIVAQNIK
jgi:hypothetical protein